MNGLQQMTFDQQGAIAAFEQYLSRATVTSPKIKSVRMTRSGKFIVKIQPEEGSVSVKEAGYISRPRSPARPLRDIEVG